MTQTIINLSSLDGKNGFRLDGEKESNESGSSVSNAGDVNGDGFDDVRPLHGNNRRIMARVIQLYFKTT